MQKSILIVGGTDGIGKAVALQLAQKGYSLTIVGRNTQKGDKIVGSLQQVNPTGTHHFLQADVSLMRTVWQLANRIKDLGQAYDVIIHTADVLKMAREETEEGLEVSIATNFYSRLLLNARLVEQSSNHYPRRIIHVAAAGFPPGKAFDKKFPIPKTASSFNGHGIGQIANDFYGFYYAEKWKSRNIQINILNPGIVDTDIRRNGSFPKWLMKIEPLIGFFMRPITKTPEQYASIVVEIALGNNPAAGTSVLLNAKGKASKPSKYLLNQQMQQYVVQTAQNEINEILQKEIFV